MLTAHRLSEEAFESLARGSGDPAVIGEMRAAQHSKHVMLLHAIAQAAREADLASPAVTAFLEGYTLLAAVQQADPSAVAWLLGLPHVGAWVHDCLDNLDAGVAPDYGYLALVAAAAALRSGAGFELVVPVHDGRVLLPSLGYFHDVGKDAWIRLSSNGKLLDVGGFITAKCADLVPGDGSAWVVPHWCGTPLIRAVTEGHVWEVLLETADRYLDRYMLPMAAVTAEDVPLWQERIQSSWKLLDKQHRWVSGPVARAISVIVPMIARSNTDLDSATTPTAFGSIATSLPPDPVIMAETLVHEFQHLKLCGLMDLVSLIKPCDEWVYAPWRPDPRPAHGLLQGVYAHLGVVRFWDAQRRAETEPDGVFRAQLMYERWRPTIELCTGALLKTGCLTAEGTRFVKLLRDEGRCMESATVPAKVREIAGEAALDHWLTWQLRHVAIDPSGVAGLADAYHHGESLRGQLIPPMRVEEGMRKIDSTVHSRLLNMRYLEPHLYSEPHAADMPDVSQADTLLFDGQAEAAKQAYRDEILAADEPQPGAWIGLGLAIHRLEATPLREAFVTRLPLIFEVHACLREQGVSSDPLDLAAWLS